MLYIGELTYLLWPLTPPAAQAIHNISPAPPVLGNPLQLLPAIPCLFDVCLEVTLLGVFWSPPLSLALRVPHQDLSGYVCAWLSQGVAKPSPSPLKDLYLYLGLVCSIPEVFVAHPVHLVYSQNSSQAMVDKCLDPYQRGLVYSPRFRSVQQHGLYICVKQAYFCDFSNYL